MFNRTGRAKQKSTTSSSNADFALQFGFITQEEYNEILKGNMELRNGTMSLINWRADLSYLKTGHTARLYQGRAEQIKIDQLLGL